MSLQIHFWKYKGRIYALDHSGKNPRIKPIRECKQWEEFKGLMLKIEKILLQKKQGHYIGREVHKRMGIIWVHEPISDKFLKNIGGR